jgi:hypothetical protein
MVERDFSPEGDNHSKSANRGELRTGSHYLEVGFALHGGEASHSLRSLDEFASLRVTYLRKIFGFGLNIYKMLRNVTYLEKGIKQYRCKNNFVFFKCALLT